MRIVRLLCLALVACTGEPPEDAVAETSSALLCGSGVSCCQASTAKTWRKCAALVQEGTATGIEVIAPITCIDSECDISLGGVTSVAITGVPSSGGSIKRTGTVTAPLITLNDTASVRIADLVLDDGATAVCDVLLSHYVPFADNPSCPNTVDGFNTNDLVVENVTFLRPRKSGLRLTNGTNVRVIGNKFVGANLFGAQLDHITGLTVDDNLFHRNAVNGLVLAYIAQLGTAYNSVMNNLFDRNHRWSEYFSCGDGDDPCGGGQLFLYSNVRWTWFAGNVFRNGHNERSPDIAVAGIEITAQGMAELFFAANDIHDNTAEGVGFNPDANPDVSGVTFWANQMWGNGTNPYYNGNNFGRVPPGPGVSIVSTCTTPGCQPVQLGRIYIDPYPCTAGTLYFRRLCKAHVVTLTNDVQAPRLTGGQTVLAAPVDGVLTPQIRLGGQELRLSDAADVELDRITAFSLP